MQDYISSNKIKENKYKILRMSLLLGRGENQEETLMNFEEASREIDAMNDEIYLKNLEEKFYDTLTLEEEEKKLAVLVDYIGGRVEQRISLLTDFSNVTGYDLTNLPPIKYYDKLDDYKERFKYIREYLSNITEIKSLNDEITASEAKLKDAYLSKATAEEYNERNEEILLNKFETILKSTKLKDINKENVNSKLEEIKVSVADSKKSLDIFYKSFATLSGSGISEEEEEEYKSYVENAKDVYYAAKEEEYLLSIYQYLIKNEIEYKVILEKRENINNLLYERLDLRKELNIKDADILSNLYDLLERQYEDINHQKDNIELIDSLNEQIDQCKEKLNELELDNQKVEILALLREFCLIDTYASTEENKEKEESIHQKEEVTENKEETKEAPKEETKVINQEEKITTPSQNNDIFFPSTKEPEITEKQEEKPLDNEVILVENATSIDLEYIHAKASKVMQRVGEMLGIKTKDTKIVSFESKKETPTLPKETKTTELPTQEPVNPLFTNQVPTVENKEEKKNSEPVDPEMDNSFWFSSDTPDALQELPDLDVPTTSNLFGNTSTPNLNFPDLNLSFGPNNNEEGQND